MPQAAHAEKTLTTASAPNRVDNLLRFRGGRLATMLRRAIDAEEILPVFQPLYDLRSHSISGFEMLARWEDAELGQVSPVEFIPLAEAEGVLGQMTESLLRRACLAAATWPGHLTLAVNISPLQLLDPELPALIRRAVEPTGFPLSRLEIELTEQALVDPLELARGRVDELKSHGMQLVMDDFGTGHAGLNRLQELPFDKIKIDRSFIQAMEKDDKGRAIVAAMINLGRNLGLAIVAEGVEEQSQADALLDLGCDNSQGWLHGRPVCAAEVPGMLKAAGRSLSELATVSPTDMVFGRATAIPLQAGLESAFYGAPVGLALLDLSFRYITVNDCFAQMYRLPIESFLGRTVQEALPGPAAQILVHLERALAEGEIVECEIDLQVPTCEPGIDQQEGLVYLRTAQPVRDEAGEIAAISVGLVDITERKRAEAALRESEENYRYTVELNPHIPWMTDAAGELTFMSPRWHTLTGMKQDELLRQGWARVLHPEDRSSVLMAWSQSILSGEPYDADYRVLCANGNWRWMRARAFPRRGVRGEIVRWYGTLEDIDDRKLAESALLLERLRLEEATEQLGKWAQEDHLTGLANRRHFDDVLELEMAHARRSEHPLALIMFDVDHFKRFNDNYGHVAGDECLRAVGRAIAGVLRRRGDLAARYGGEEFAIVLPDTTEESASRVAVEAIAAVRKLEFARRDEPSRAVTISAGVAMLEWHKGLRDVTISRDLVRRADLALYQAKGGGRDRVVTAQR